MTKIMVNTDLIDKNLITQAKTAKNYISKTKSSAQRVGFPNDEYSWSNITSQIADCENALSKYINWINEVNNDYKKSINNFSERLDKIKIEKLDFNSLDVK